MRVHEEKHPLAGKVVKLKNGQLYAVEDWADRVLGRSVWSADGNPAALKYAIRSAMSGFPSRKSKKRAERSVSTAERRGTEWLQRGWNRSLCGI